MTGSRRCRVLLALVLASAAGANLTAIDYGQPAHYDQAVDGLHPLFALDAVRHVFSERSEFGLKYPRLHYLVTGFAERAWLLMRHGRAESDRIVAFALDRVDRLPTTPPARLRKELRTEGRAIGELIIVGRCVAAALGVLLVWTMFRFTRRLAGEWAALIAAALTAVSYPIVYYSHTLNVDVPYITLGLIALDQAVAAIQTGRTRHLVLMGVFAALAGAAKDQVYGWFVLTIPLILWMLARPGALGATSPARPMPWRGLAIAAPIAVVTYLVAFGVPWDMRAWHKHFDHIFGEGVDPFREFQPTASGHAQLQLQIGQHLTDSMGFVLPLIALIGFVVLARKNWRAALLVFVAALSYDATFIAPIGYCYVRFVIPIALMLFVAAGAALVFCFEHKRLRIVGALLLAFVVGENAWKTYTMLDLMRHEPWTPATAWIDAHIEPTAFVVTSFDLPLQNIDPPTAARVEQRRTGDVLPPDFGVPDWIVTSVFDAPRTVLEVKEPMQAVLDSIAAFGTHYALQAKFVPLREHPIRRGAAFQPQIAIYRKTP